MRAYFCISKNVINVRQERNYADVAFAKNNYARLGACPNEPFIRIPRTAKNYYFSAYHSPKYNFHTASLDLSRCKKSVICSDSSQKCCLQKQEHTYTESWKLQRWLSVYYTTTHSLIKLYSCDASSDDEEISTIL